MVDLDQFAGGIPDSAIYTGREVKRMLRELLEGEDDVVVSTTEASRLLDHSADWWRRVAQTSQAHIRPRRAARGASRSAAAANILQPAPPREGTKPR